MCDKRDSPITYVFGGDLHLCYCFLVFYMKTCLKESEVRRKSFSSKIIVTLRLSHKVCRLLSTGETYAEIPY